jgi:drug/metabolite transporter (DMT)-like permease
VSATDAALIYSLEPVAGALMAYMFLGERWGAWGWAGGAVILAASMLTQLSGAKSEHGGGGGEGGGAQAEAVAGAGAERQ